ncbi:tyrosine-type recombinase/integrase [Streptomyces massasporeus]|uniref:tyrosine-type recombinase/integrase n=1 Tax=Streptomyces massasporeus TaxID=67324 RepID=UPI0033A0B42C
MRSRLPRALRASAPFSISAAIIPDIRDHLERYAEPGADGRVFLGAKEATPRRNHFNRLWRKACNEAGIKGMHFHDLRHTGNTLAASTAASTRELMTGMGHSTARVALIYQHASAARDRLIADALSAWSTRIASPSESKIQSRRGTPGIRRTEHAPYKHSGPGGGVIL